MGTRFEADPLYGCPCESYQLQIGLAAAGGGLVAVQRALADAGGDGLHLIPPEALHVTVLPLIDAAKQLPKPKAEIWARHEAGWRAASAQACRRMAPFRLRFTRLRAEARAVIALDDENPLAELRAALAGGCGLPERPVRRPQITHATLLRVRDPEQLRLPGRLPALSVEVPVRGLRLVRETVFPTLAFDLLAEYAF
ncbi:hypothetical protein KPL78_20785 [Roseomonas sp. HJA6]|uniref:2'-5' RNA ligase n=1 Tax=Roseomonas alba TaxID=2846776 RepID=A0ABS7AG66_9PROT|nr:2'-5' RNA ligase family protein [Neoroseomonas alba]MBW6400310.1 hypothetical protein [Neoroseomonas alba]